MAKPVYVINGPNLNRLGTREPHIYGTTTLREIEQICRQAAGAHPLEFRQSNAEADLVDWIHEAIDHGAGIVINAAGLTFTSVPIVDALKMFAGPIVELHISNLHRREPMYQHSLISATATAVVMGLGADGYRVAVDALLRRLGTTAPGGARTATTSGAVPESGAPKGVTRAPRRRRRG
jgi:3-dehydroquinate dehydratase-2